MSIQFIPILLVPFISRFLFIAVDFLFYLSLVLFFFFFLISIVVVVVVVPFPYPTRSVRDVRQVFGSWVISQKCYVTAVLVHFDRSNIINQGPTLLNGDHGALAFIAQGLIIPPLLVLPFLPNDLFPLFSPFHHV